MTEQDVTRNDWEAALAANQTLVMVVELGLLSLDARQSLFTEHVVWPLLLQPGVTHLTNEGPALIELSGQPFIKHIQLSERFARSAQHGWLSSRLDIIELQKHLGDALACRNIDGDILLIRSYAQNVLPILHARQEQLWHTWLFGPIVQWWLPTTQGWQRLQGLAQGGVPPYHPIELDQPLVEALGIDPHAQALVTELQANAPEIFVTECHGERLNQAGQALSQAREVGLTRQPDQYFYALYSLLGGKPISQNPNWPEILQRVEQGGQPLAQIQVELDEDSQG
jgi:hypothetical protein